eukprot:507032-Amphidinium_carterae.1
METLRTLENKANIHNLQIRTKRGVQQNILPSTLPHCFQKLVLAALIQKVAKAVPQRAWGLVVVVSLVSMILRRLCFDWGRASSVVPSPSIGPRILLVVCFRTAERRQMPTQTTLDRLLAKQLMSLGHADIETTEPIVRLQRPLLLKSSSVLSLLAVWLHQEFRLKQLQLGPRLPLKLKSWPVDVTARRTAMISNIENNQSPTEMRYSWIQLTSSSFAVSYTHLTLPTILLV